MPGIVHIVAYLLWLVSVAACVVAAIQLRAAIAALWAAFGGDCYTIDLVSQVGLLVASLAAFTYAIFLEGYYRKSVPTRAEPSEVSSAPSAQTLTPHRSSLLRWLTGTGLAVLLRRFAITIAIPLGATVLSLGLLEIALRTVSQNR